MKIIELRDIYVMLSDGVGENCMVYHNGANVFSNMERIYHSPNFTNSEVLGENPHTKLYLQLLDMEDKTL
jgi:hypothetical protein